MKLKTKVVVMGLVVVSMVGLGLVAQEGEATGPAKALLRVGVYDSRAVAIAFANSEMHNEVVKQKMADHDKAKADGDQAKVKELEAWGNTQQERLHLQGFGTEPVSDILAHIKDELPRIASDTGVDVIVSKWQLDFTAKDAQFVDVTQAMVMPFKPSDKVKNWIRQLKDNPPVSRQVIEQHEH